MDAALDAALEAALPKKKAKKNGNEGQLEDTDAETGQMDGMYLQSS